MALYDAGEMRIVDGLAPSMAPSRYGERRAVRWPMLLGIVGAHVLLAFTLDLAGMLPARRAPSELKLIQLSPEAAPPPPVVKAELPQQVLPEQPVPAALLEPVAPSFDAPPPVIAAPAVVITAPQAQPPPPAAVLAGPLRISDLDAKAITVVPPKYPIESRRRREQGTVVLRSRWRRTAA
jgi:periplasmic protein TonB